MSYQILTVEISDRLVVLTNASRQVNRVRQVRTTQLRTACAVPEGGDLVAREPECLMAQRKALGVRLRELRRAQGHTQAGIARCLALGRYERTSIAHIESGRQSTPREF